MDSDRRPPFFVAVRSVVRLRDGIALATVPAVLCAAFLLPAPRRRSLVFEYADPSPVAAVAAHFVHFDPGHLLANVVGYALVAGVAYLLAALAGCRRLFGVAATTYLLGFPPVLSVLNLAVPRDAVGYGFSGINMAFVGVLPVLLAVYANRRLDPRVRVRHAPGLFVAVLGGVALSLPPTRGSVAVLGIAAAATLLYAWAVLSSLRATDRAAVGGSVTGWLDLFVLGVGTVLGYALVGFSAAPVVRGAVVNRYVHLLGFCLAFLVPYVGIEVGVLADRRPSESAT
jgi:hypothetical protein